ncbi:hypothetical protein ACLESD_38495 [Pyxidicoccus sp. 3LFB2]
MRMLQLSTFAVFALAVGAVWQTSSSEPVTSVPSQEAAMEQPGRCGAKGQSQSLSAMSSPGDVQSSRGPQTLEESGAAPGAWGSCIDCSSCLSARDCAHVGGPCYTHCP